MNDLLELLREFVKRVRIAAPVMLVYWAMLLAGLALYSTTAADPTALRSIAIGALAGTALGNLLAVRDIRAGMAAVFIFLGLFWVSSMVPHEYGTSRLWMAFLPAAFCGYWSLGDREALAAFWFPAMVWMLSILDRTGVSELDTVGVGLVCALGVLFIVFLRARETRRAKLWQAYAPVPLATPLAAQLLRETPGRHVARFAWTMFVAGTAVALTAWIAPQLWRMETSAPQTTMQPGVPAPGPSDVVGGAPAYADSRPCCTLAPEVDTSRSRVKEYFDLGRGHDLDESDGEQKDCRRCETGQVDTYVPATDVGASVPSEIVSAEPIIAPPGDPVPGVDIGESVVAPVDNTVIPVPGTVETHDVPPSVTPPVPPVDHTATPPESLSPSTPPTEAPHAPAPHLSANVAPKAAPPPTTSAPIPPPSSSHVAGDILRVLGLLAAGAVMLQLVSLALRPIRRAITLRHLRRPFWRETVDQRVSNAWQLALVGLRDAGWCASSTEAPRQFAARIGVAGLERCALILERARHGLGLDAEDLSEMGTAANEAYRAARQGIGPVARVAAQVRWPLA